MKNRAKLNNFGIWSKERIILKHYRSLQGKTVSEYLMYIFKHGLTLKTTTTVLLTYEDRGILSKNISFYS